MNTHHPVHRLCLATALLCACGLTYAQTAKPGLWESSSKMTSSSGEMAKAMEQMQKQMASMPPEQRKKMEEMMAKQGGAAGLRYDAASGVTTAKVCLTQDMLDQNKMPMQTRGDCKHSNSGRTGNTMKFSFSCATPPSSGEGITTFTGNDSYHSKVTIVSESRGKPETMTIESTGKFLSADCGNVKPLTLPQK
jgi:hypothetical protein